ncbi:MAG: hypothetical protein ACXAB7_09950 [Candidatus Kariarchaeaceae archaeon]|jgi:hypothetical protein
MATYRYVALDIQKSLKKAFDDADVRLSQVIYWVQVVANKIRVDQQQKTDSGLFVSTFSSVSVSTDPRGRQYIDLPGSIMDLPNEGGIEFMTYNYDTGCCCAGPNFAHTFFQPTKVSKLHRLFMDPYEKPTPQNPYFYRIGDRVDGVNVDRLYLLGTDCIKVSDVEIGLNLSLNPTDICSLDEQVPVPDERIEELMKTVLELGRWVTLMPEERINQGADDTTPQAPPAPATPLPPEYKDQENAEA